MNAIKLRKERLNCIALHAQEDPNILAFLALGSASDQNRLDAYSDLDFFLIVKDGYAHQYIQDLSWLSVCAKLGYQFQNTVDGYKVLYEDGIFSEFAVFNASRMKDIAFVPGTYLFNKDPKNLLNASNVQYPVYSNSLDFLIQEALTNLYIGLARYHRGEKLAAFRLIQVHAVNRILEIHHIQNKDGIDPFALERRFEQRHPENTKLIESFCLGYTQTIQSAQNMLNYLESIQTVNPLIKKEIETLFK
jgi:Streptomycin adenylyltransferase